MIMQKIIINFPMTILHEATFPRINEMGRRIREALTIETHFGRAWVTRAALLHGVTFTPERAEGSLHGEGCFPDVQTAPCTSAIRWGAYLYTYIGPMVPRCSKLPVLVPF